MGKTPLLPFNGVDIGFHLSQNGDLEEVIHQG